MASFIASLPTAAEQYVTKLHQESARPPAKQPPNEPDLEEAINNSVKRFLDGPLSGNKKKPAPSSASAAAAVAKAPDGENLPASRLESRLVSFVEELK